MEKGEVLMNTEEGDYLELVTGRMERKRRLNWSW